MAEKEIDIKSLYSSNTPFVQGGEPLFGYAYYEDLRGNDIPVVGTKSLFNEYSVFYLHAVNGEYNRLYDIAGAPGVTPEQSRNPSAAKIISWSQTDSGALAKSTPYSFADFAYCSYYGHIPNNYMVTLRRFPVPMLDNLGTYDSKPIAPIAQAVTFIGEKPGNKMSEFMKQTLGLNWDELTAGVQDVEGNERGYDASLGALFEKGGQAAETYLNKGLGDYTSAIGDTLRTVLTFQNPKAYSGQSQAETEYAKNLYNSEGPYANKVYGPVNVVNKTYVRKQGLHHDNEIKLNFHYTARSIGGINPKAAMLDLISNFLAMTFNNAKFWGGAIRYWPQHPNVPFFGDQQKFYDGDVKGYINSVTSGLGAIANSFTDQLSKFLQNPLQSLKQLGTGAGKLAIGSVAASSRPQILSFRSLLTGAPIGEWHLVVGNPMNPVAMIGNLICADVEMEFGDILGADDFPTEVKFTVTLKHGKPRDKGDIESMLNLGNGRLYYGINGDVQSSSMSNSIVDVSGSKGNKNAGLITDRSQQPMTSQDVHEVKQTNSNSGIQSIWGSKYANSPFSLNIARRWSDGPAKEK